MTQTLTYDGRNLKAMDRGFADVFYTSDRSAINTGANIAGNFSNLKAFSTVAQAAHCINIRGTELSRVPRELHTLDGDKNVSDDPKYKSLLDIGNFLYRAETSRCIFGEGYGYKSANAFGFQVGLEWMATPSLIRRYNPTTKKLAWFDRKNGSQTTRLELENVIYLWNFNPADENTPGPADLQSALGAASILYALDSMIAAFVNSGGVKVTVFPVDSSTNEPDYKAFQNWLNRRISGISNAYRNVVMRLKGDLKPVVIGSDLKDMDVKDLSEQKKEEIAVALGIPPNVVDGSYKYATADSEYLNFLVSVIFPRLDETLEVLNDQFYRGYGLKMIACPEKMEIMQTAQLLQAASVMSLTGKPIMTVDEGREKIELKPMGGASAVLAEAMTSTARLVDSNTTDIAGQIGTTALGSPAVPTGTPQNASTLPVAQKPRAIGKPRRLDVATSPAGVTKALTDWRRAALESVKSGGIGISNNPEIPLATRQALNNALLRCTSAKAVREAFEAHWPRLPKDEPVTTGRSEAEALFELAAELRAAREALQETEK